MTPSFRLSAHAEQSLKEIISWTIRHFGIDQARTYKDQLINRVTSLSKGELPHGRSCNVLLPEAQMRTDLEYFREGRHYIVYRNTTEGLFVADFIHGSRNLSSHIKGIAKKTL